jgi:hypothetical protein
VTVNYQITEVYKEVSVVRLTLRLPPLDGNDNTPSEIQRVVEIIEGSPEGVELGWPGDMRIEITEPAQLWIKSTGFNTRTGWTPVGGGGGAAVCNLLPMPIVSGSAGSPGVLATAARCDHEHPAPVIPSPSNANPLAPAAVADPGVSALYSRDDHVHPEQTVPAPSDDNPQPDGVAAPGVSALYSRGDHVHPVASAGEQTVYEIDFRELDTQPFADGPVVIGDRTWIAGGVASFALTWGLINGQGLVGTVNNSAFNQWNDASASAVRIYSTLGNLDPNYNPMARYGWEVELTANNASSFGAQCRAILGLFKPTAVEPGTEQCAAGLCSGNNNTPVYGVGLQNATTTAPMVTSYGFPATTVMRICNQPVAPGTVAAYVAPPSGGPGWPALSTYRGCGFVAQSATGLANLTTSVRWGEHPDQEIHIVMASASGLGFGLTFSRFRVVRFN